MSIGTRSIVLRPGVGAAGRIIQRAQLTSHSVAVDLSTLILVQHGRKHVSWSLGECTAGAGEAIAIQAGQVVDISNTPGVSGAYNARWISWTEEAVDAFRVAKSSIVPFSVVTLLDNRRRSFVSHTKQHSTAC